MNISVSKYIKVGRVACSIAICFLLASVMTSCVDTVILPDDKTVDEDFWQNSSDVSKMVNGAYSQMTNADLQRSLIVWGGLRSDELVVNGMLTSGVAAYKDINGINIQVDNTYNDWAKLYSVINYCNIVLKKAPAVMDLDPNYLEGDNAVNLSEMKALRALCYLYLIRIYRDVPLVLDAYMDSSQDMNVSQTAPSVVIDQVINDLEEAWPNAMRSESYLSKNRYTHMTKNAIWATLADAYLWRASVNHDTEDYKKVVVYCDSIKEAHKRTLSSFNENLTGNTDEDEWCLAKYESMYNYNFSNTRKTYTQTESLFEISFTSTNLALCQMYNKLSKSSSEPYMTASKTYSTKNTSEGDGVFYGDKDCRGAEFVYSFGSGEASYVRKYVASMGLTYSNSTFKTVAKENPNYEDFNNNWVVYRLSDVMLMKAEALVQLVNDNEEDAAKNASLKQQAFNLVRIVNARSLADEAKSDSLTWGNYSNSSKDALELLVMRERSRELCFEGKRWFDLLRYNYRHVDGVRYDQLLVDQNASFVSNYREMLTLMGRKFDGGGNGMLAKMPTEPYLYMPIYEKELETNPNLKQNPVYSSSDEYTKDY